MTGPVAIFEGPKGFDEVFGMKLDYDWDKETFELIAKCVLKKFNVEVHAQATLEAIDELKKANNIKVADIESVDLTTFLTAYHIIGSGAYGDRQVVETKEQADHSLFYAAAVCYWTARSTRNNMNRNGLPAGMYRNCCIKLQVRTGFPLHEPLAVAGMLDPYTLGLPG
jgi:2-methylcitrate dehydratase